MNAKALVKLNSKGRWYYQLRDGKGQQLYASADFPEKAEAMRERDEMTRAVSSPRTTFVEDWCGWWTARLFSATGRILATTDPQQSKEKARDRIGAIIGAAKRAEYVTEDA